jgi:hypothetical protein
MSTIQDTIARPTAGIDLEDPIAVAAELRDQFRVGAAERDRKRQFPYEQCAAFRASGLLGLMVPREFGGYGASFHELMQVVILISAGDSNIGQMYQLHTGGIRLLEEFAPPEVQAKWLPRFANGELWIANAYSEFGTPSVNDFNTTVAKVDHGWLLNGTKFYCTGSLLAHWLTVLAKDDHGRTQVAIIPADTHGVTIVDDWAGMGQRTTASGTVKLDSVDVGADMVVLHHRMFERPQPPVVRGRRRARQRRSAPDPARRRARHRRTRRAGVARRGRAHHRPGRTRRRQRRRLRLRGRLGARVHRRCRRQGLRRPRVRGERQRAPAHRPLHAERHIPATARTSVTGVCGCVTACGDVDV